MPEGNPLVVDAKKDPDGPGAFTAGNGDYGWAGGIGIAESSMDAFNGIKDGDWVSGGLGMLSLAGEVAGAAIDPFGYLMSSVASFLMEHVQPLKDVLDSVAGNPPVIQSYADTWGNVSKALGERKTDFDNAVKNGTTGWTGAGADAYRKFAAEHSDALSGAATVAGAISTVTMIMGQVVSFVRETVRQLIADLVGKLIAWVMEEVFSLGFGTPVVVAQASAAIAKWGKKIGELLKKLTDTIRKVSPLLSKLVDLFEKIAKVFGKVLGKVSGLDGLKVKEGGFVRKIPKGEGGGVHARAHGGADGDSPDGSPDSSPDGSHDGSPDGSHGGDGDGSANGADSTPDGSPSAARNGESGSSARSGDTSRAGDTHAGDSSPSPSQGGDGTPSHAGDSGSSPTRSPSRAGDSPSHAGDSSPSPARGSDSTPSHSSDSSPSPTRGSDSAHTSPSPAHRSDSTPSHTGDSSPSPTRGSDSTPTHTGDSSPSPARGDSTPAPTRGADTSPAPGHADGGSPAHSGSSPAARSDAAATDTPSSAAPPRADGTSASGTAPAVPRTGEPGTQVPSPRGGDATPAPGGPAAMGGGMPPGGAPGGAPGGGGLGGGSPRAGGPGWTGTPGTPGAHVDAPARPRTGGELPEGRPAPRPRTPDAPEPAARGFGPGTHGPGTPTPGPRTGAPHGPDGTTPGHGPRTGGPDTPGSRNAGPHSPDDTPGHGHHDGSPHDPDGGPPENGPHDSGPLTPDEVNARHSESTPSGSSYHAGDPDMGDLPHRVHPDPDGRYTVDVHVTPDGHARIGDRLYTPEEFADVLRRNGDYDGRPVRLIGCDASSNDFAHRLSRELDTEVLAPTRPAWTDSHGRVFSSDYEIGPDGRMRPRIPPDGEWNAHQPDGSTHRAGDDGFAPGTHDRAASADTARARGDEPGWQDRPGPDGRTPRENIADPKYIEKHYYRRPTERGEELVINHRHANVDPPPPQLDLVNGEPRFKSERPPAESLGFDESRSSTHPPQRAPEHDVTPEGHEPATGHDPTPEAGELPDARNWRETDYDRIDDRVHDRQVAQDEYHDTPKDADDWVDKHNARNDASERLGEEASGHAVRDRLHRDFSESFPGEDFDVRPHPDAPDGSHRYQIVDADGNVRAEISPRHPIDGGKPGAGNFDHIWEVDYKNGGEPHYIVHEAKGPGGQPSTHYDRARDRTFQQGHPEYFDYLVKRMEKTDPDLAEALERAKLEHRLDYVEVRARVDESVSPHVNLGYDYKPYNGYGYQSPLPAPPAE